MILNQRINQEICNSNSKYQENNLQNNKYTYIYIIHNKHKEKGESSPSIMRRMEKILFSWKMVGGRSQRRKIKGEEASGGGFEGVYIQFGLWLRLLSGAKRKHAVSLSGLFLPILLSRKISRRNSRFTIIKVHAVSLLLALPFFLFFYLLFSAFFLQLFFIGWNI